MRMNNLKAIDTIYELYEHGIKGPISFIDCSELNVDYKR